MVFHSELKVVGTSFLCIITPFIILITVKLLTNNWEHLFLTGDWSIASAMIYSSAIITVRSAANACKNKVNDIELDWFMAVTITMACLNIAIYVVALMKPSFLIGFVQIFLFLFASIAHIKYGRVAFRLREQ